MGYYAAIKRNEILAQATTWISLEDITLSEISQSQKDKYCMIPLMGYPELANSEAENRMLVVRGLGMRWGGKRVTV